MNDSEKSKILFITDQKEAYKKFSKLLVDIEAECKLVADLESVILLHSENEIDLMIYWYHDSLVDDTQLSRFLNSAKTPPGLVLMIDTPKQRDYINAINVGARDVVDINLVAQFMFVIRREISHIRMSRKLDEVVSQFEESCVVDEAELHIPLDSKPMASMVNVIDDALKKDQFELLFQPIMCVEDDNYDNYEVFLRIKKDNNYIMPGDFLPVAEQYGFMPAIDRWVVKKALYRFKVEQEVKKVRKGDERKLRFFLNISVHSLVDEYIISNIVSEIIEAKLEPGSIVIEVDKNMVLSRLQKTKSLNQNIKKLKLEFAIDHYEESDNSLNYLKHISLDYIKCNQELISDIATEQTHREAVREIVKKARENNIKVIACQVENADILPILYDLGVDYIQGFAIAGLSTRLEFSVINATIDASSA